MSDLLIKNMENPKSCAGCYMFLHGIDMGGTPWHECAVADRETDNPFGCGKPDWCPLVELPPHGRLVDADEMYEEFVLEGQRSTRYKLGEVWELNGKEIRRAIYRLPTVIPASKEAE